MLKWSWQIIIDNQIAVSSEYNEQTLNDYLRPQDQLVQSKNNTTDLEVARQQNKEIKGIIKPQGSPALLPFPQFLTFIQSHFPWEEPRWGPICSAATSVIAYHSPLLISRSSSHPPDPFPSFPLPVLPSPSERSHAITEILPSLGYCCRRTIRCLVPYKPTRHETW